MTPRPDRGRSRVRRLRRLRHPRRRRRRLLDPLRRQLGRRRRPTRPGHRPQGARHRPHRSSPGSKPNSASTFAPTRSPTRSTPASSPTEPNAPRSTRSSASGTTDQIISDHLATGPLQLATPRRLDPGARSRTAPAALDDRPGRPGDRARRSRRVGRGERGRLRSHGLDDIAIARPAHRHSCPTNSAPARRSTTRRRRRAIHDPLPVKPVADAIVADLLVSAGRHPAALRQLAESTGQPSSVVDLAEERMRRAAAGSHRHGVAWTLSHRRMGHAKRRPTQHAATLAHARSSGRVGQRGRVAICS